MRSVEDARRLLAAGADKVSVNSAAVTEPDLLARLAEAFGSQCVVLAIDARREGASWQTLTMGGRVAEGGDAVEWARRGVERGAGEILLTSWDRDGTREGYDLDLLRRVAGAVPVPVIASGGVGRRRDLVRGLAGGRRRGARRIHLPRRRGDARRRQGVPRRERSSGAAMIIPCIDIINGQAVQLRRGRETVIEAGDPLARLEELAVVGEVAVIDLDAALGRGSNAELIREMVRRAPCRVGGGIRDLEAARGWLDAGAERIVLGTAATPEICAALPAARVIAAVDSERGEVVVDGWRTRTGEDPIGKIAELREHVGGFLVTFVEHEGCMGGFDFELVERAVAAAAGRRLTVAGGVTTAEDVARLDRLGADAQVGMALYTGRLGLGEGFAALLDKPVDGRLWPTVVCDELGATLGLVWSTRESVAAAIDERRGIYWSRSRDSLWRKGETSGDVQELLRVDLDCDRDALRFTVRQSGGFCHTGERACWPSRFSLGALQRRLAERVAEEAAQEEEATEAAAEGADRGSGTIRLLREPRLLRGQAGRGGARAGDRRGRGRGPAGGGRPRLLHPGRHRALRGRPGRDRARAGAARPAAEPPADGGQAVILPRLPAEALLRPRRAATDERVARGAAEIVAGVRAGGEEALRAYAERLDGLAPGNPLVHRRGDLERALAAAPDDARQRLERIAGRIRRFAEAQLDCLRPLTLPVPGGAAGHELAPVERAGCYAPGGRYPLPSSALMTAIPARVAGVETVWLASPRPAPVVLWAAAVAGADGLLAAGGAQAVAALALGAGAVPAADVVVGPGNLWVTAAKQLVAGEVAVDLPAGPSELLVIGDAGSDPARIAADLLAQAEHDELARPWLLTIDARLIDRVEDELASSWPTCRRRPPRAWRWPAAAPCSAATTTRSPASPTPWRPSTCSSPSPTPSVWPPACATTAPCSSATAPPRSSATTAPARTTSCPPAAPPATAAACRCSPSCGCAPGCAATRARSTPS